MNSNWKNGNLISKTGYSIAGLKDAVKNEKAIRNEIMALTAFTIFSAVWTGDIKTVFMVFLVCLVPLIVELINTAFEVIVDWEYGENYREEIRMSKDMLSSAVFLALIFAYAMSAILIFF